MLLSTFSITVLSVTASIVSAQDGDWVSNWDTPRTLLSAFDVDPEDARSMMRGSGDVEIGGGVAKFFGSPRLYISHDDPSVEGWENVEITAYGKYVNRGISKSYMLLTDAVRLGTMLVFMKALDSVPFRRNTSMATAKIQSMSELFIATRRE